MKLKSKENYIKTQNIVLITDPKKVEFSLEGGETHQANGFIGEINGHDVSCAFLGEPYGFNLYFRVCDYKTGISFASVEIPIGGISLLKDPEVMKRFIKERFIELQEHLTERTIEKLNEQLEREPKVSEAKELTEKEKGELYDQ